MKQFFHMKVMFVQQYTTELIQNETDFHYSNESIKIITRTNHSIRRMQII